MLTGLKNGILVLACSLLMLHNFTPHTHHAGPEDDGLFMKNSIPQRTGLLQKVFQVDLGCNHLEEASQTKFNYHLSSAIDQLTYSVAIIPQKIAFTSSLTSEAFADLLILSPPQDYHLFQSLRAPPAMA